MAQAKGKSTKKKTTTRKQAAAKKTAAVSNKQKNKQSDVIATDYWHAFTKTKFFKFLLGVIIIVALIGLDLLIAWDDFTKFFTILGFEVLIAAAIWLFGMLFSIGSSKMKENEGN